MTLTPRKCELLIRPAEERDTGAIQRVVREAWDQTFEGFIGDFDRGEIRGHMSSKRALLEDIGRHSSEFLVATVEGTVVGFAELVLEGSVGEVARVAVRPAWQHNGIASTLLRRCLALLSERDIRQVTAGIEVEDGAARSFFRSHGFRPSRGAAPDLERPEGELVEFSRTVPDAVEGPTERIEVWCDDGRRYCPRCRRRYPCKAERCEECGSLLDAELPARPDQDEHRFVPLLRTDDQCRVSLVSSALEGSEIAFSVHEPGGRANGAFEIWVAPGRLVEAREVIDTLEEAPVLLEDE